MPLESCAKDLLFWPLSNSKIINLYCLVESELRLSCDRICETPARMRASLLVTADGLHIALVAILHRSGSWRSSAHYGLFWPEPSFVDPGCSCSAQRILLPGMPSGAETAGVATGAGMATGGLDFRFCCLHCGCRHQGAELRGRCETGRWLCWWRSLVFQSLTSFCSKAFSRHEETIGFVWAKKSRC